MATILFIDDEPLTLSLLSQAATILGHKAFTTDTIPKALALAKEFQPDLIVTDIHLDGCNSMDFIDQCHQNPEIYQIPIVTLSAMQSSEAEALARSHGAVAHLSKPIRLQTLLEVIGKHAQSQPINQKVIAAVA